MKKTIKAKTPKIKKGEELKSMFEICGMARPIGLKKNRGVASLEKKLMRRKRI